jgi:hypothetical protein
MNPTDIYLRAIKRTFADLYGVSPDTVDVSCCDDHRELNQGKSDDPSDWSSK